MKSFAKMWKKIVIAIIIILSIMCIMPKPVFAAGGLISLGGTLMKPICSFLVGVGDGVMDIIHDVMVKQTASIIRISMGEPLYERILNFFLGVVVAVVIAAIVFSTGGSILAPIGTLLAFTGGLRAAKVGITCLAIGTGVFASFWMFENGFWGNNEVVLPAYAITPEEIFKNDDALPLFSVNFFDLDKRTVKYHYKLFKKVTDEEQGINVNVHQDTVDTDLKEAFGKDSNGNGVIDTGVEQTGRASELNSNVEGPIHDDSGYGNVIYNWICTNIKGYDNNSDKTETIGDFTDGDQGMIDYTFETQGASDVHVIEFIRKATTKDDKPIGVMVVQRAVDGGTFIYDLFTVPLQKNSSSTAQTTPSPSPTPIYPLANPTTGTTSGLSSVIPQVVNPDTHQVLTPIDVQNQVQTNLEELEKEGYEQVGDEQEGVIYPMSYELSKFVFAAYRALRYVAIVGMMSVLVYIGIRIVISSTAGQKAKYKERLGDWVIGMVLLFTMHYIMYFANIFVEELSKFLNTVNPAIHITEIQDENGKIEKKLKSLGYNVTKIDKNQHIDKTSVEGQFVGKYEIENEDGEKETYIEWYTNLMGALRVNLNYNSNGDSAKYIGYTVMFIVMIIYTITFMWTYIKRVIYMAFLTLISPLVALTYPIDKITDGKAQGFNFWFREYIFNLLLQPMHLLLYTILVSAAISFAGKNIIYSIVALGFIGTAEKIMRQMFNFQKASTPGVLAGPAGAAMTMAGMRKLLGRGPQGGKDGKSGKGGSGEDNGELYNKDQKTQVDRLSGIKIEGEEGSGGESGAEQSGKDGSSENGGETPPETGTQTEVPSIQQAASDLGNGVSGNGGTQSSSGINSTDTEDEADTATNQSEKTSRFGRFASRVKDSRLGLATKGIKGALSESLDNKIDNFDSKNAKRKIYRAVGGLTVGAAAATVGLATGIASGNASSAFKNAGIGAAAGWKAGSGLGNSANKKVEGAKEAYRRARYTPEEYKEREDKKNQKKFVNNRENIRKFADKTNRTQKEAKEWLEKYSEKYRKAGIDDVEEMAAIEKTLGTKFKYYDSKTGKVKTGTIDKDNRDHAIGLYQISQIVNSEKIQGKDNTNKAIQRIRNMGFSEEMAEAMFYGSTVYGDIKNNVYNEKNMKPKAEWNKEDAEKRKREQEAREKARIKKEKEEKERKENEKAQQEKIQELQEQLAELEKKVPTSRKRNRKAARNARKKKNK